MRMSSSIAGRLLKFSTMIPPKVTTCPMSAWMLVVVSDSVLTGPWSASCIARPVERL